jgi:NOL1/NOP2/fmu family ribosome biogenesis protein
MKVEPLNKSKKKKFLAGFENLGELKTNALLLATGTEKIRAFTGEIVTEDLMALWRLFPVDGLGLYVGKEILDKKSGRKEFRLSLDGLHFFKEQIKKDILILDEEETVSWFRGENVELENSNLNGGKFVAVSDGEDLIGTAKVSNDGKVLVNFLPKERRRKENG